MDVIKRSKELQNLSKKELIELVIVLEQRIAGIEIKLNIPKKTSQNSSLPPSTDIKPSIADVKSKGGGKKGHKPHFRKISEHPDRTVSVPIEVCPNCGMKHHNFTSNCHLDHQILELKTLEFEIIEFQRQKSTCCFGKPTSVLAPNPVGVLDNDFFGPRLKCFILILYYEDHLSYGKIRSLIKTFSKIEVSKASIINVIKKCGKTFQKDYEEIQKCIRAGNVVGIDETGWRVLGDNCYLWTFNNNENVLYKIDRSRSSKVVNEVLEKDYAGVIVSDFYSVYGKKVPSRSKQKCIQHLLRDLVSIFEQTGYNPQSFSGLLLALFREAIHLKNSVEFGSEAFVNQRELLERRLDYYTSEELLYANEKRITKRLIKHRKELFVFLYELEVPPTNNMSEQALRNEVIHRKISHGNRSLEGKKAYEVNTSVLATMKKKGENLFSGLMERLESKFEIVPKLKIYTFDTS